MDRQGFDDYIRRFNARDPSAFDDYLTGDMRMLNGALSFTGVAGMRDHYENKIWPDFDETISVLRFVSDDDTLAVQLWTRFVARRAGQTLFGEVEKGETFDFRGLVMYEIRNERFAAITVAYNSFVNAKVSGETIMMDLPH